jgi:hypothetical protein
MGRLTNAFVGRDTRYFELFEEAAANVATGAELLERMLRGWPDTAPLAREIKEAENEGDRITAELINRINQTFVTPLDREDVIALAAGLDDVIDLTEEVADYLGLYRVEAPMEQAVELAAILHQAARQIAQAMPHLRNFADLTPYTHEVHRLENEGDRIAREGIAALFDHGIDPMTVIRWKDVYERLEGAIDATERAANIVEGVVIKNA